MPETTKSRLGSYRRPSDSVLDSLTDPGGTLGAQETSDTSELLVTEGNSGTQVPSGTQDSSGTRGNRGTSQSRGPAKPRDHIKVDRELAQRMRNAVWFLAEHGRARVQLGELIDEAVSDWLAKVEAEHNGGEAFPDRGRLR